MVTAFTDGDRGGELIIKELLQIADIDYVARAPEGKCVEDLSQKEIVRALRQKIPVEQVLDQYKIKVPSKRGREVTTKRKSLIRERPVRIGRSAEIERQESQMEDRSVELDLMEREPKDPMEWFMSNLEELNGTLSARLFDRNKTMLKEVAVRDLAKELKDSNGDVTGVVFDGVVTQRILDIAAYKSLEYLIGAKMGNIAKSPVCVKVVTRES